MPPVLFSLCIPTMNRFDDFLDQYLEIYLDMKNKGIIDEIIVCDETGEDYQRILEKYNKGDPNGPIQLYKNETTLGAFKNKLRVATYAKPENFIALIDSDNLVDETYFEAAKYYIENRQVKITDDVVLCPSQTMTDFEYDYSTYIGKTIDYMFAREYGGHHCFHMLLNTGNYIMTRRVYDNLVFDDEAVHNAGPFDVIYKHLLAFYQNPRYRVFVIPNMKYAHAIHAESYYFKEHHPRLEFYYGHIIPQLCSL